MARQTHFAYKRLQLLRAASNSLVVSIDFRDMSITFTAIAGSVVLLVCVARTRKKPIVVLARLKLSSCGAPLRKRLPPRRN
jgi:hypothetical protein